MFKYLTFVFLALQFHLSFASEYVSITKTYYDQKVHILGVQWNEDYIVTSKKYIYGQVDYQCSTSCDIIFIKHKSQTSVPEWRDPISNEELTMIGLSENGIKVISKGNDSNIVESDTFLNQDIQTHFSTNDSMELSYGVPVYGNDGKVVGFLTHLDKRNNLPQYSSTYIPYSEIQKQWDNFQSQYDYRNFAKK